VTIYWGDGKIFIPNEGAETMPTKRRVRLSSKGQLVIPKDIRDRLGLDAGDELVLYLVGDRLIVAEPVKPSPLEAALAEIEEEIRRKKISPEDIERALQEARKEVYEERFGRRRV